ncbi:MAG: T9SS type A sorting domain-containing protein [Crocinitomicaceae bacterium]|nr:T9SS type A sorting domain-containing protein [Crocinitomicaceae bacterium]
MTKNILLLFLLSSSLVFSQQQIGNSDFEQWENVGAPNEEPINWNSFKTASGSFASFASKQIEQSSNVRPGSSGTSSSRVYSVSTFGIVANGNMTIGKINMGSTSPAAAENYNYSVVSDSNFSEALTSSPDSIVFWVKYTPVSSGEEARMKAAIHDNYEFRDPTDANSASHLVATAELNYPSTAGNWERKSVPFVYSGPSTSAEFILLTFTTNKTPGGGDGSDEILIDDVELIYNSNSITGIVYSPLNIYHSNQQLLVNSNQQLNGKYQIFSSTGLEVKNGPISSKIDCNLNPGIYFFKYNSKGNIYTIKFYAN